MIRAVISIGSNMADRQAALDSVVSHFSDAHQLHSCSSIYSTPPWGVSDQAEFLNAVLIVDVLDTPRELLGRCQGLEQAAHRVREQKWGPRTLDVDIIQVHELSETRDIGAELSSEDPILTLPHPWAQQRAFVLIPWLEVDDTATLKGRSLKEWLADLPDSDCAGVVRL